MGLPDMTHFPLLPQRYGYGSDGIQKEVELIFYEIIQFNSPARSTEVERGIKMNVTRHCLEAII
jgi:hypothetical protein